jgi:hypothetical protein
MLGFFQLDAIGLPTRFVLFTPAIGSFLKKVDVAFLHKPLNLFEAAVCKYGSAKMICP